VLQSNITFFFIFAVLVVWYIQSTLHVVVNFKFLSFILSINKARGGVRVMWTEVCYGIVEFNVPLDTV